MFQINSLAWLDEVEDEQNKEVTTMCVCVNCSVYEMEHYILLKVRDKNSI